MESLLVRFKPQLDLLPGAARERVEAHIRFRAAHAVPEFVQVVEARKDIEMELAAAEVVRAARSGVPHRKAKKKDLNARVRWTKRERE